MCYNLALVTTKNLKPMAQQPRLVERFEDMSPRGRLRVLQQEDGDMVVCIVPDPHSHPDALPLSVEFCSPGFGGGKSPRVVEALRALMHAMAQENRERPRCPRRGEIGEGVDNELTAGPSSP